MALFESYERREAKILAVLKEYGMIPSRALRKLPRLPVRMYTRW